MEEAIIDNLILNSENLMKWATKFEKKRYLFEELEKINKEYYLGIKGIRGIGKTVLMLQLALKEKDSIYFSADSDLLKPFSLYEIIKEFVKRGFKNIFIDEIHRKVNWDSAIKTIFDEHQVRIIFSGSSTLNILKTAADLSRRVTLKELKPASFREFLNIRKNYNLPVISFESIIKDKISLTKEYTEIYQFIEEYMEYGGVLYPKEGFFEAVENSLRKVILQDLSSLRDINIKYETDVYKLLYIIAKSPPYKLNYSSISRDLGISKTFAIRLVNDLESTGIIITIFPSRKIGTDVKKEPKLYLTVPLRKFFSKHGIEINKGALREEFFVNHFRKTNYLKNERGEKTPDFKINNKIIEVGEISKSRRQGADYIAVDGLSTDSNKIPLFLFGLVY